MEQYEPGEFSQDKYVGKFSGDRTDTSSQIQTHRQRWLTTRLSKPSSSFLSCIGQYFPIANRDWLVSTTSLFRSRYELITLQATWFITNLSLPSSYSATLLTQVPYESKTIALINTSIVFPRQSHWRTLIARLSPFGDCKPFLFFYMYMFGGQ